MISGELDRRKKGNSYLGKLVVLRMLFQGASVSGWDRMISPHDIGIDPKLDHGAYSA